MIEVDRVKVPPGTRRMSWGGAMDYSVGGHGLVAGWLLVFVWCGVGIVYILTRLKQLLG